MPGATPTPPELDALFARIPRVDAVRRPRRAFGVAGWGRLHWVAMAVATAALFWLYSGSQSTVGPTSIALGVAALLGGFVLASYVPGRPSAGAPRAAFSPCAAMPLLLVAIAPTVMSPPTSTSVVLLLGLLALAAVQRLTGAGCRT